jgi:TonB family protein
MNTITYFLEANIAIAIIAVFYQLILKNETNFQFQRLFIIGGVVCSLIFPLIQIKSDSSVPSISGLVSYTLPEMIVTAEHTTFELGNIIVIAYGVISSLVMLRLIWNLSRLAKIWRTNKKRDTNGHSEIGSFSFLNMMFIDQSYRPEDKEMIFKHEQVHARLLHSIDIILIEILKVIFWVNPFIYLIRKQITSIHEFQADEFAVKDVDAEQYCSLLARVALQSADFPIANHFNNSLTLKRIIMITKEKVKLSRWKVFSSAAVMVALFVFISCSEQESTTSDTNKPQTLKLSPSGEVFTVVEDSAIPADGLKVFYEKIATTLVYPADARKKGVQGKVLVQFIVNLDGTISDTKVLHGIGSGCDEAALKAVVESNVKWIPGKQGGKDVRMQMVIPINFQIDGEYSKNTTSSSTDPNQKQMDELVAVGKKN